MTSTLISSKILTNSLINRAKKQFTDKLIIRVKGGQGGSGLPKYGGIGGKGGDVCIAASSKIINLAKLNQKTKDGLFQAANGEDSRRSRLLGLPGRDLRILVPLGVTVEDSDRQVLGNLNEPNDQVVVALGGRGGDKFSDNHGHPGQYRVIRLDLKTISDIVFVGFPNAGKSSLLRAVSRAKPKVAEYPFTTLRPYLGSVQYDDLRTITMADLPGLVEGAHKNLGLGHDFLKHMVRARVLVFVIDVNDIDLGPNYPNRTPLETLYILNKEIEMYDDRLLRKPAILLVSKMDSRKDALDRYNLLKDQIHAMHSDDPPNISPDLTPKKLLQFDEILPISTLTNNNINNFKKIARDIIDKYAELELQETLQVNGT